MKKQRELTDRQHKFLDVLFDKAHGDVVQAKLLAGYSEHTSTSEIVNSLAAYLENVEISACLQLPSL